MCAREKGKECERANDRGQESRRLSLKEQLGFEDER